MQADVVLDCKGMRCPRPIVEMAKSMRKMGLGEVLELQATDPVAQKDVPAWCHKTGNELLGQEEGENLFKFFVKKSS